MNIKNILPFAALFMAAVLRMCCEFFLTDPKNGFIIAEFHTLGAVISLLIFVFIALAAFFAVKSDIKPKSCEKSGVLTSICSLILAISVIFGLLGETFIQNTPPWSLLLSYITGILAVLFLLFLGIKPLFDIPVNPVFYVLPLLYFTAKLVSLFSAMSATLPAVDNTLFLGSYCAEALFLLEFSRNKNGISLKNSYNKILALGFIQIGLSVSFCLSAIIGLTFGIGVHEDISSVSEVLCSGLFTAAMLSEVFTFNSEGLTNR